jgi:hypothetical protein
LTILNSRRAMFMSSNKFTSAECSLNRCPSNTSSAASFFS